MTQDDSAEPLANFSRLVQVLIQQSIQTRAGWINTTQLETQYLRDQRPSLIFGI